jgi:Ca2+-binding EF-hand superfamily protein
MGGHRMGKGGHGGAMMGMLGKMADTNNDGAITQAEFTAAALKHFDTIDADHNGTVTAAERQAARADMKAKWQQRRADAQTSGN